MSAAYGVGGESDATDIALFLYHFVEAVPVLCGDGADALVGVDFHENPIWMRMYELGVVIHLGLIAGELLMCYSHPDSVISGVNDVTFHPDSVTIVSSDVTFTEYVLPRPKR